MKNRFTTLLTKWPIYLVGVIASSIVTCAGISIKCSPKLKESIYVFAPTYSFDVKSFVKTSLELTDGIRQITVKHADPDSEEAIRTFGSYYSICDFYIMPESWLTRITPIALSFTDELIHSLLPNSSSYELYKENDTNLGIKIFDKNTNIGASTDIISYSSLNKEQEDYYLIFRQDSIHLGELNNSKSDNALRVVNNLLK